MRSMQCNLEFGYHLSIRSGTKENHGKPRSSVKFFYIMFSNLVPISQDTHSSTTANINQVMLFRKMNSAY
jgi:hypothetical protein